MQLAALYIGPSSFASPNYFGFAIYYYTTRHIHIKVYYKIANLSPIHSLLRREANRKTTRIKKTPTRESKCLVCLISALYHSLEGIEPEPHKESLVCLSLVVLFCRTRNHVIIIEQIIMRLQDLRLLQRLHHRGLFLIQECYFH